MYNKNQWYSYTYIQCEKKLYQEQIFINKFISGTNVTPKFTISQRLMVWFRSSGDRVALTEIKCTKHVAASKLYKKQVKESKFKASKKTC